MGASDVTRGSLLDATIRDIATHGVDRVRAARIAGSVGLTTGALFGRWANLDELLVDTWTERIAEPLLAELDRALRLVRAELPPSDQPGRSWCPPDALMAAADLLIVARRRDELGEAVIGDLRGWVERSAADGDATRTIAVLAVVCGGTILRSVGLAEATRWDEVIAAIDLPVRDALAVLDEADPDGSGLADALPIGVVPPAPDPDGAGDALRAALHRGAEEAVIAAGVAGATVTRIARRAGVDRMALYRRYNGIDELLVEALRTHLRRRQATDGVAALERLEHDDPPLALAASLVATTEPPWRDMRTLRLEVHAAARHEPLLAASLTDLLDGAIPGLDAVIADGGTAARELADRAVRLYQSSLLGLALVVDVLQLTVDRRELFAVYGAAIRRIDEAFIAALGVEERPRFAG